MIWVPSRSALHDCKVKRVATFKLPGSLHFYFHGVRFLAQTIRKVPWKSQTIAKLICAAIAFVGCVIENVHQGGVSRTSIGQRVSFLPIGDGAVFRLLCNDDFSGRENLAATFVVIERR